VSGRASTPSWASLEGLPNPLGATWIAEEEALLAAAGSDRVAAGLEQTLARLQEGRVRELLIARRIDGTVRQCERCGWVDWSADSSCARCGGQRRTAAARVVIPDLARRQGVSIDVVAGRAATRLRRLEGIALAALESRWQAPDLEMTSR
jgi:hypothetical protein